MKLGGRAPLLAERAPIDYGELTLGGSREEIAQKSQTI